MLKALDLSKYHQDLPPWLDLWDKDFDIAENIQIILPKIFKVHDDYYPLIISYLLCNSAISRVLPILFVYGRKGSGKSTLGYFAGKLWGVEVKTSADTVASIRYYLDRYRHTAVLVPDPKDPEKTIPKAVEKHSALILDDIDDRTFIDKPDLYRIFKCGYDRNSSVVSLMGMEKQIEKFETFSAKILSSIKPLHTDLRFDELHRRMLIVNTTPIENHQILDLEHNPDFIQINDYNWNGFESNYQKLWASEKIARLFIEARKSLSKRKLPFSPSQKTLVLDLMATSIATGLFFDYQECINYFGHYFEKLAKLTSNVSPIIDLLTEHLKKHYGELSAPFTQTNQPLPRMEISANSLKTACECWYDQAYIEDRIGNKELALLMRQLGYQLDRGYWIKQTY